MPGRKKRDFLPITNNRIIEFGNGLQATDIGSGSGYRGSKTDAVLLETVPVPLNTVVDNPNGTITINQNAGGIQDSIRPVNELNMLSGSLDTTSDRIPMYDVSTSTHVWVPASVINAPEVFRNNGPLSGVAPSPYKVGIDYSTGTQYYVNGSGNWQAFPPGTTVVLTDLPNGKVSINASLGGTQEAIRPIDELTTAIPTSTSLIAGMSTAPNQVRFTASSILGLSTNTLANSVNTMTSTVNGIAASAPVVNTVALTQVAGKLTSTVNGVSSTPILDILTPNFDNDLGVGADGKVETGFSLHRNTTTSGAFYRHWSNNTASNPALSSSGLLYGVNSNLFGGNSWDTALTTGVSSILYGNSNKSTANYNSTFGVSNTNGGYSSITAGNGITNNAAYSAVFGNTITASGNYHLIGGYGENVSGTGNNVGGYSNTVTGSYSSILGYSNTAAGNYNGIIGYSQTIGASGSGCMAFGYLNNIIGGTTSAIQGYSNFLNASYSFIGGISNGTLAAPIIAGGSIVYGNAHVASGSYHAVFGGQNTMTAGSYNFAAGLLQKVSSSYNAVTGYNNTVTGFGNNVSGYSNIVAGERSVVGGNANTKAGQYGAMFGNSNIDATGVYGSLTTGATNQTLGGWNNLVAGDGNIIDTGGQYTKIVLGYQNKITTNTHVTFALGQSNTIGNATGALSNVGAGAIGSLNTVSGSAAIAIGQSNTVNGNRSYALGNGYIINAANQVGIAGTGQSLGFYGVTPVARQNGATITTVAQVVTALRNLGLVS